LVKFVVAVAGEAVHGDGLEQAHLVVEAQGLDGHAAEFREVSDPDHSGSLQASLYSLQQEESQEEIITFYLLASANTMKKFRITHFLHGRII
jgi:carboxypeptidase C (cathepsin A)